MKAIVLWLLVSSAAAQTNPGAYDTYIKCLRANAPLLDDDRSDPRSVGTAVLSKCRSERMRHLRAMDPTLRDDLLAQAMRMMRESDIDDATAIVLEGRLAKQR